VIPRTEADLLFGLGEELDEAPLTFIPGTLDAALSYIEVALLQRDQTESARQNDPALLLVARTDAAGAAGRLAALIERADGRLGAVVLGAFPPDTVVVDASGTVAGRPGVVSGVPRPRRAIDDAPDLGRRLPDVPSRFAVVPRDRARDRILALRRR
jgi:hypothetical protein